MKIDFCIDTEYGKYCDALHLPDDHAYTEAQIEEMKQARVTAWIKCITTPPVEEV